MSFIYAKRKKLNYCLRLLFGALFLEAPGMVQCGSAPAAARSNDLSGLGFWDKVFVACHQLVEPLIDFLFSGFFTMVFLVRGGGL